MSKIRVDSKNPLVTYSSLGVTSKVMSQWKFARDWAKIQLISCDRQRLERLNLPDLWYTFSSPPPPCYHWHVISNAAPSHRLWNVCSICTQPLQYVVKLGTEKRPESLSIKQSLTLNVSYSVIFGQSLVYVMIPLQSVAAPLQHSFSISIVFHDSSQTINIILFIGHRKNINFHGFLFLDNYLTWVQNRDDFICFAVDNET